MAKVCAICGKSKIFGNKLTFSHRKINRTWSPNLRKVRAMIDGSLFLLYYYIFWQPAAERITFLRNLQRTDMPMDAADFSSADISAPVAGLIPFTAPEEVLAVLYSLAALVKVDK